MKKFILLVIVLGVGIALGVYFQRQPKTRKIETQVQTDAEQAGADVKEGVQQIDAAAAKVKEGVQKAGDVATNVVGQVKVDAQKVGEAATNAVGEIKQKLN
jgi:beta-lactam-binding protein with PASTA domain